MNTVKKVEIKNRHFSYFVRLIINETRKIVWHETCKCVCRLTSAICNDTRME